MIAVEDPLIGELGVVDPHDDVVERPDLPVERELEVDRRRPRSDLVSVLSVGVRRKLGLPSRFDIRLDDPLALVSLASAHPDLTIVIPHFAAGFTREALMAADLCPNIVFDTSSSNSWIKYHPGLSLTGVFHQALHVVGPDRLMFGTDSSFFPRGWQQPIREQQQAVLRELGVDHEAQEKIFAGTFDRVYGA